MLQSRQQFTCACCGGFIGEASSIDFVRDNISPGHQRRIFDRLAARIGRDVSKDVLVDALYADRADGGPTHAENIVSIEITRLRRAIEPFGWSLISRGRGSGNKAHYRIIPTEVGP